MIQINNFSGGLNGIPQFADRQEMWKNIKVTRLNKELPNTIKFTQLLSDVYRNGSAKHCRFEIGESEVFDWYISRGQFKELRFFEKIWEIETIKECFSISGIVEDCNTSFVNSSSFILGGTLSWALYSGGAYSKPDLCAEDIKDLCEATARELINGDFENTEVYESDIAWCDFFNDIAWDNTWIILNKKTRTLDIILATDTD